MQFAQQRGKSTSAKEHAAAFVDYENLYSFLSNRAGTRARPEQLIAKLLHAVREHLQSSWGAKSVSIAAYADFASLHGPSREIQRALYLDGVEPRFVPGSMQHNAAEIQVCVDAIECLHTRSDIGMLAIVTADRFYLPLVQHCQRTGARAVVITFRPPEASRAQTKGDLFINADSLLDGAGRNDYGTGQSATARPQERSEEVEYTALTDPAALNALEIIDEHFGHYDEIYLTPLLRKLSEMMGEDFDPKQLISEIEEAGAIWLEKRKGYPYDYTVLLLDVQHPNVADLQQREFSRMEDEYGEEYEDADAATDDRDWDEEYGPPTYADSDMRPAEAPD